MSSELSTIMGNTKGSNNTPGNSSKKKETPRDDNKQFREKHAERYGKNAVNQDVQQDIKEVIAGMGDVAFGKVLDTNNKN